jgi:type IV secretory pathway TraG/TraD family ATPase VirD4
LGERWVWGGEQPVGLRRQDRRQHLYVVGKTGTGKTTLLRNLILQDIEAGEGVGLIDPHGDLAEELLDFIPKWRTDHVLYFDPADGQWPVGFNLLKSVEPHRRHLVASAVVGSFKSIWRDSWGPRLSYLLYASVAALLECQNTSLLGVQRMLADSRYRDWVVRQVRDPAVRSFWEKEFAGYDRRFLSEVISPVQNKVGQLLMSPPVRLAIGQVRSRLDPRFLMDNRRILIANLSKGRLGEDKSALLGALLVSQFQAAAMARAEVPEEGRRDFYLYIDEFHNFTTDSFASILSEARK